jgi:hypothetical protein
MDYLSNLCWSVQHVNLKSQSAKHFVPCHLERPGCATHRLYFRKRNPSLWQKHKAVGHSIVTGADEFRADAAGALYYRDQFLLYGFFSHNVFLSAL